MDFDSFLRSGLIYLSYREQGGEEETYSERARAAETSWVTAYPPAAALHQMFSLAGVSMSSGS